MDDATKYPPDGPPLDVPSRDELALWRHAGTAKWAVPAHIRDECLLVAYAIVHDPRSTRREKLAAARVIDSFDRSDVAAGRLDLDRERLTPKQDTVSAADAWGSVLDQLRARKAGTDGAEGPSG